MLRPSFRERSFSATPGAHVKAGRPAQASDGCTAGERASGRRQADYDAEAGGIRILKNYEVFTHRILRRRNCSSFAVAGAMPVA